MYRSVQGILAVELDKYQETNETSGDNNIDLQLMMRRKLAELERLGRDMTDWLKLSNSSNPTYNKGEAIAQSILAMRHLEDASMRYGKIIQYHRDGESVYDKI